MTREDLYEMWAPARSAWAAWAKPVLFASIEPWAQFATPGSPTPVAPGTAAPATPLPATPAAPADATWAPDPAGETAVIVDLPNVTSVAMGMALAHRGYRPVPVFNGNDGMGALIELSALRQAIATAAPELMSLGLVDDASPAFLLDSRRSGAGLVASPGKFDNRWLVFPQDFPSGNLLRSRGIRRAIVCQLGVTIPEDLRHVLLRWQEAGIAIAVRDEQARADLVEVTVARPGKFRSFLYRLSAIMGFRRNSAGGFGSHVPQPSSGGGGGYRGGFS